MLSSFLTAMLGIVGLMIGWMLVQAGWRRAFADYVEEEDVLAERRSCGNCGCSTTCRRPVSNTSKKS
jgi:hypothetical protein